jgi:hypothetical protein
LLSDRQRLTLKNFNLGESQPIVPNKLTMLFKIKKLMDASVLSDVDWWKNRNFTNS